MSPTTIESELLVRTDWVDEHRHDDNVRIIESDEDLLLYQQGHIREAVKIDWQTDLQDQTIRDYLSKDRFAELCALKGISNDTIIAYCRIGERSSHTWFVLKYLLGFDNVKNYDGSWTEWGNLVGVPIEKTV